MNFLAAWLAIMSAFRSMFSKASLACDTSFSRAFRASTRRLLMPPAKRNTKWNGAKTCCILLTISSAASASRRLRPTDAPDSSYSRRESLSLSSVPGRERQFHVYVRTVTPAVVGFARDVPKFLKSCMIPVARSTRLSKTCVCRIGSQSFLSGASRDWFRFQIVPMALSASFRRRTCSPISTDRSLGSASLRASSVNSRL